MATNIPSPANMSDDDGGFSISSTPTPGPSAGMRRTFSDAPPHHHQGTSYFPPSMTAYRPTSPPIRRMSTSGSRYPRTSSRPLRSTSVSTASRRDDDESDKGGSDEEQEEDTPNASGARAINNDDVDDDDPENQEPEFNEDDPLTVKTRQLLINVEHPFGLPIWKPALYKKSRTVTRDAEAGLHSVPKATIDRHFIPGNAFWAVFFGWWLAIIFFLVSVVLWIVSFGGNAYSKLVWGLSWYIWWPFGAYLEGDVEDKLETKATDDGDDVTPTLRPNQNQSSPSSATIRGNLSIHGSDIETTNTESRIPLTSHSTISTITPQRLGTQTVPGSSESANERTGLFAGGVGKTYGIANPPPSAATSVIHALQTAAFWLLFISIIAPLLLIVTLICWALILTIPMAKLNWVLLTHMWHRPTQIRFRSAPAYTAAPLQPPPTVHGGPQATFVPTTRSPRLSAGQVAPQSDHSTVLLCTYRAAGLRYYKYTVGGVNIMFINLIPVVFFVIFDGLVLLPIAEHRKEAGLPLSGALALLTGRALIFTLSLLSVIPLSYFIGMAVASISAQSSIGMGAVINATFGSIIEVILYGIALTRNKGRLVEGSIVGSVLAGVLLMPGLSMCGGALRKKEQKFNAKSANVTSTMLIMAIIGVLTPTMFYQVYGNFTLICDGCPSNSTAPNSWECSNCYYEHADPTEDPFYQHTVKSFMYFCAGILVLSYLIGLWFSLRTHASQIWQNPQQLMHPLDVGLLASNRLSLSNRLTQLGLTGSLPTHRLQRKASQATTVGSLSGQQIRCQSIPPLTTPRAMSLSDSQEYPRPLSPIQTRNIINQVAFAPVLESIDHAVKSHGLEPHGNITTDDFTRAVAVATVSALRHQQNAISPGRPRAEMEEAAAGHDAPSWSRSLSASVLLGCTFLYAIIAEILVEVVDVVLEGSGIQEKFLGITLFALVPNTTEFMNAISFAMNGNISLSMEIGSAYALQVCLLQIPAMVAFSAWYHHPVKETISNTFTLIFPRWDVVTMVLSIFLLTYTYIEAKANYHRGSILIFSYLVLGAGFYFAPPLVGEAALAATTFTNHRWSPTNRYLHALYTFVFTR